MQGVEKTTKLILGSSGTGKTSYLLKEIANNNSNPQGLLWVAYNQLCIELVNTKLRQIEKNIPITTFPAICAGLIKSQYAQLGFSEPPRLISYAERKVIWEQASHTINEKMYVTDPTYQTAVNKLYLQTLCTKNQIGGPDLAWILLERGQDIVSKYFSRFNLICIDDVQDYLPEETRLIKLLNSPTLLAGDINGSVMFTASNKLLNTSNAIHLTQNYRSNPWVTTFYNQLSEYNELRNPYQSKVNEAAQVASQIYAVALENTGHQLNWIAHQVANCLNAKKNISVGIICRGIPECAQVSETLKQSNIPNQFLRLRNRLDGNCNINERVTIGTIQDLKGFEFSVVILPSAVEGNWPYFNEKDIPFARRQVLTSVGKAKSMVLFGIPALSPAGRPQKKSRFIEEGNTPELVVHQRLLS